MPEKWDNASLIWMSGSDVLAGTSSSPGPGGHADLSLQSSRLFSIDEVINYSIFSINCVLVTTVVIPALHRCADV